MTLEELETRAARWGADIRLWPDADRVGAERALAASANAREIFAMLAAMEAELSDPAAETAPVPAGLTARILADAAEIAPALARPARPARARRSAGLAALLDRILPAWRPAAACAASAFLGVWLGYLSPDSVANAATDMASMEPAAQFSGIEEDEEAAMSFDLAYVAPEAFR